MRVSLCVVVGSVVLLVSALPLRAQSPCRQSFLEMGEFVPDDRRYKNRNGICEGEYYEDVGASAMTIVSLAYARRSGIPETDESLELTAPGANPETIEAKTVGELAHFRMDAAWQAHTAEGVFHWPMQLVGRLQLNLQGIGLLAKRKEDVAGSPATIVLPVSFSEGAHDLSGGIEIVVEVYSPFDRLEISWNRFNGATQRFDQPCGDKLIHSKARASHDEMPQIFGVTTLVIQPDCRAPNSLQKRLEASKGLYNLEITGYITGEDGEDHSRLGADPMFFKIS